MVKATMSFDDYDTLVDRLVDNCFKAEDWWPTVEEIQKYIEPNVNKNIEFLLWILETADTPITDEQKASKKYINNLLIKTLKITD